MKDSVRPTLLLLLVFVSSCYHFRSLRIPDDATPEVMYERAGCAACHGQDRWGTDKAPGLRELAAHWTVDQLAKYIAEPGEHRDARLEELDRLYETEMPGSGFLSRPQREALAEWLMGYE